MAHETLIEKVKSRYAQADEATLQAVLLTLQEDAFNVSLATPALTREISKEPTREVSKPPLKFVGENPSPEAFRKLSFDERGALSEQLQERNGQWLAEKFAALKAAWLMVMDGEVTASGDSLRSYPRIEQIHEAIARYGKQPFTFINDFFVAIEESHSSWHPTNYPNDFYPTVSIILRSDSGFVEIVADFDTGAASSFVDYNLLLSHQVIVLRGNENVVNSKHLGEKFKYSSKPIDVEINFPNGTTLRRELPIQCVGNWNNSPFVRINPHRTALAGRDIFLELKPAILLDFANRRTTVVTPPAA